jgi:hypothetical protein
MKLKYLKKKYEMKSWLDYKLKSKNAAIITYKTNNKERLLHKNAQIGHKAAV